MDSFSNVNNIIDNNDPMNISLSAPFTQVLPDDVSFLSQTLSHSDSASSAFLNQELLQSINSTQNTVKNNQNAKLINSSNIVCIICGKYMISVNRYHKHNIKKHTLVELSRAILKLRHLTLPRQDPHKSIFVDDSNSDDEVDLFNTEVYDQFFSYGKNYSSF